MGWGVADSLATWFDPDSSESVMTGQTIILESVITEGRNPKYQGSRNSGLCSACKKKKSSSKTDQSEQAHGVTNSTAPAMAIQLMSIALTDTDSDQSEVCKASLCQLAELL